MLPNWLSWTLLTLLSWGIWAVLSKVLGEQFAPIDAQILSSVGFFPVLLALAWRLWGTSNGAVNAQRQRIGRGLSLAAGGVSAAGNLPFYHLLSAGNKASTAVAMTAMAPLVTVVLAVILLHERLNRVQMTGLLCSLGAIYLFNVASEQGLISNWLLLALIPIGLWGLAGFLQKLATQFVTGESSALWFLSAFPLTAGVFLLWRWPPLTLTGQQWCLVSGLGFSLALGNFTILMAFASGGKASVISPLCGLYPLVSAPLAIYLLGERVTIREGLGIGLAMAAVVAIACETRQVRSSIQSPAAVDP